MTSKLTPLQQYQIDVRAAKDLNALREARQRLELALGSPSETLRGNMSAPAQIDRGQALREAFGRAGLDPEAASVAAGGKYAQPVAQPVEPPRQPDAYDAYAESLGYAAGSPEAVAFRRGRYQ